MWIRISSIRDISDPRMRKKVPNTSKRKLIFIFKIFLIRVVEPNTLNVDLQLEFWPTLDPNPGPDPDLGFCYKFSKKNFKNNVREKQFC